MQRDALQTIFSLPMKHTLLFNTHHSLQEETFWLIFVFQFFYFYDICIAVMN